jgi:hypothetical protein
LHTLGGQDDAFAFKEDMDEMDEKQWVFHLSAFICSRNAICSTVRAEKFAKSNLAELIPNIFRMQETNIWPTMKNSIKEAAW